jgi:hypothetical protein
MIPNFPRKASPTIAYSHPMEYAAEAAMERPVAVAGGELLGYRH